MDPTPPLNDAATYAAARKNVCDAFNCARTALLLMIARAGGDPAAGASADCAALSHAVLELTQAQVIVLAHGLA
ncbi:MAG: hypothetical protein KGK07_07460 [Chloroflexota bacterium]|nr:hypothetical protein [Chloroflexota bacterium]